MAAVVCLRGCIFPSYGIATSSAQAGWPQRFCPLRVSPHLSSWPLKRAPTQVVAAWVNVNVETQDLESFTSWLRQEGFPVQDVELKRINGCEIGCIAACDIQVGEGALRIPENYTVTCVDVAKHPVVSRIAAGRSDLIGLSFWLMYEKWLGRKSLWHPYINTFPSTTLSPLTWKEKELETLLKGTSLLVEAKQRIGALEEEFGDIMETFKSNLKEAPPEIFNVENFKRAFSVVLSRAIYLPTAELFSLVPIGDALNYSGECASWFDYSIDDQAIVLRTDRKYNKGEQVYVSYGQNRPNSDLMISYGLVDENNPNDFVEIEVGLADNDPLKSFKKQILFQANFEELQAFPLYNDRFPIQMLSYMRLARLQDPALLAKIALDRDIVIDQANEYEVLTLILSECHNKLTNFDGSVDDEISLLKRKKLSPKEEIAAKLRLCEKKIWCNTMSSIRKRLAPIRGIPTKSGAFKDSNSDIKDMFDKVEQVASAPRKFLYSLMKSKE